MATEIKTLMEGKWIVYKTENFGKFLDALGVGPIKRKVATSINPKFKLTVAGDVINATLTMGPKKNKAQFKLGEPYEVEANDIPSKAVASWKNGKLRAVITPNDPKKKGQVIEREIVNGEMLQTMTTDGVTAILYFKRRSHADDKQSSVSESNHIGIL